MYFFLAKLFRNLFIAKSYQVVCYDIDYSGSLFKTINRTDFLRFIRCKCFPGFRSARDFCMDRNLSEMLPSANRSQAFCRPLTDVESGG